MNLEPALAIVNKSQLSESIHEKTDSRPSCAYHFRETLLTHLGDYSLGLTFLAEMSEQKKNTGESFFTGIEKLVNQILFVSDVPRQQIRYEHVRKCVFAVKHFHHRLLLDSHHRAIGQCSCGAHAECLPSKA